LEYTGEPVRPGNALIFFELATNIMNLTYFLGRFNLKQWCSERLKMGRWRLANPIIKHDMNNF
jgi:hypothetical protein